MTPQSRLLDFSIKGVETTDVGYSLQIWKLEHWPLNEF